MIFVTYLEFLEGKIYKKKELIRIKFERETI